MISYLARRVATALLTVFVVISLSFFIIRLMPGDVMDYLVNQLSRQGNLTTQEIQQQVNAIYGVLPTSPAWKQYFQYIWNVCQGNFGTSISHPGESVSDIIASALPWTVFSVGVALISVPARDRHSCGHGDGHSPGEPVHEGGHAGRVVPQRGS